ncbi:MAG: MerR family transcriptional regulator [Methylocystis sp.]|uniref:MerR family transcriptional regulator n=1 Tax=Methylocystis sp. TaxID=1911079 RepID=UPI003DA2057E
MYSITSLCRLTGLNASTLRSWERRYGVPVASRTDNGRRLYSRSEVERLSILAGLVKAGHMIGDLVEKSKEDLAQMAGGDRPRSRDGVSVYRERLAAAVAARDYHAVRRELVEAITLLPAIEAVDDVIAPFVREIGAAWLAGTLSVYEEHIVTALTRQVLFVAGANTSWPRARPTIAFTSPSDEIHEIGILLAWFLAGSAGLNAIYLGPLLPAGEILGAALAVKADIVAVSTVNRLADDDVAANLVALADHLAPQTGLWVGAPEDHPIHSVIGNDNLRTFDNFRSYWSSLTLLG